MFLIVDLETNGLSADDDILQIAILEVSNKVERVINRYYFPRGKLNKRALAVHGLSFERIANLRAKQKATYADHFEDDNDLLSYLRKKLKVSTLVAFNVDFEKSFLEHRNIRVYRYLDLMRVYTPLCNIKHHYYGLKYPKLSEAVGKFVDPLPMKVIDLMHNALIDAYYTYRLLKLYPYLVENRRVREFEEEFQKEMFKEYPVELWLKERFIKYRERIRNQRRLEKEFKECLEKSPDAELIVWKNLRITTYEMDSSLANIIAVNNKRVALNTFSNKRRVLYLFWQFLRANRVMEISNERYSKIFNLGNAFLVWFKVC